jgi:hypothetical protein
MTEFTVISAQAAPFDHTPHLGRHLIGGGMARQRG